MARARRTKHVQLPLLNRKGTGKARLGKGGEAPRVGRPRKQGRRNTDHLPRPVVRARRPLHVVLRVLPIVGNLRRRDAYRALRKASEVVVRRAASGAASDVASRASSGVSSSASTGDIRCAGHAFGAFRIVHISIQRTHVHLLVEADDRVALSRGLQAFQISAAKHLNAALGRKGRVFADRYHASEITNPRQARNALAYVLNNWHKHREGRGTGWKVDPYSTAVRFDGWRSWDLGRDGRVETGWRRPPDGEALVVQEPASWLLRLGWERHGAIAVSEVPGAAPESHGRLRRVRLRTA